MININDRNINDNNDNDNNDDNNNHSTINDTRGINLWTGNTRPTKRDLYSRKFGFLHEMNVSSVKCDFYNTCSLKNMTS